MEFGFKKNHSKNHSFVQAKINKTRDTVIKFRTFNYV